MNRLEREAHIAAFISWQIAFSNWLLHRTDEAALMEHAARHHYLLLSS